MRVVLGTDWTPCPSGVKSDPVCPGGAADRLSYGWNRGDLKFQILKSPIRPNRARSDRAQSPCTGLTGPRWGDHTGAGGSAVLGPFRALQSPALPWPTLADPPPSPVPPPPTVRRRYPAVWVGGVRPPMLFTGWGPMV